MRGFISLMVNQFYIIEVIFIIIWAIGFFGCAAGGLIRVLLVIAVMATLIRIIQGRKISLHTFPMKCIYHVAGFCD